MSRIGKMPVKIPSTVTVEYAGNNLRVKGPKGELTVQVPKGVDIKVSGDTVLLEAQSAIRGIGALHGVTRAHVANAVTGVTDGWNKKLELVGVGYRAAITGANLQLSVGYSHPVMVTPPDGITFAINEGKIVVSGINKHLVGEVAAHIRKVRKPEPYKGKGIRYVGEYVRKKAGKAAKAIGGAPGS